MLVSDLKNEECKTNAELLSKLNVFLAKNNYSKDDLDHCCTWLAESMVAMEKTFNRVKYERDTIQESTANIKKAYDLNLENNQKLAREAKGLAYKIWRYDKKKGVMNEVIDEIRKYKFPFWSRVGKKIKASIEHMDTQFENYDSLVEIDQEATQETIDNYMKMPVNIKPNKISQEEFDKLMKQKPGKIE
jgi:phage-related tail protein